MPNAKRASMREGPLAALFRKTAEDAPPQTGKPKAGKPASKPAKAEAEALHAAETPQAGVGEPPAEPVEAPKPQRRAPHPSVAEPQPELEFEEPRIPSPQERLRHAFSADIPHNVMDRPRRSSAGIPATPDAEDVYARSERISDAFAPPRPVGSPVIRVVGVGGAGVNAVNRMIEAEIEGVDFVAINTDLQSLQQSAAAETLHIGDSVTRGLGSGSNPELGRQAAREEYDRIKALLRGSDMVFIAAGAGGGTGTGAAPVVAQIAREVGALTVGIVTRPFQFEGSRRSAQAEAGIASLAAEVDTLIVVPNNRLLTVLDRGTSMVDAFRVADDVLRQGVQGVSDLVTLPGLINLDFADVRTIMSNAGNALLGIGMGTGERRAIDAAEAAVASPLLETSMEGARSILLSITGGPDLSLWEVNEAAKAVAEAAHPDANIIFGAMLDEKLADGQVWVTVVATGYRNRFSERDGAPPAAEVAERPRRAERDWSSQDRRAERDRPADRELREPAGEPRVSRRERSFTGELDVPEFIPRR
jgi:cell division protein FtsZ